MTPIRLFKKHLALVFIPALLWLFFSSLTNWHYHLTPSGEIVRHSHPYASSTGHGGEQGPFQTHDHSQAGFIFIQQFSKTSATETEPCEIFIFNTPTQVFRLIEVPPAPLTKAVLPKNILRGPPSLV